MCARSSPPALAPPRRPGPAKPCWSRFRSCPFGLCRTTASRNCHERTRTGTRPRPGRRPAPAEAGLHAPHRPRAAPNRQDPALGSRRAPAHPARSRDRPAETPPTPGPGSRPPNFPVRKSLDEFDISVSSIPQARLRPSRRHRRPTFVPFRRRRLRTPLLRRCQPLAIRPVGGSYPSTPPPARSSTDSLHHAHVIVTDGESYRMREARQKGGPRTRKP